MSDPPIMIGGIVPLTTIDFPGCIACVVFCQGCSWRCRYCHNAHLQPLIKHSADSASKWNSFLEFLQLRRGFLDGVVLSGGEPTIQRNLPEAIQTIRKMGFQIGLHTAGPDPKRLNDILCFVDWIGLDIKAPFDERYQKIAGSQADPSSVKRSLQLILDSGVPYQIRTTVHPKLLTARDVDEIQSELRFLGAKEAIIQAFRPDGCQDSYLLN